MAIKQDKFDVVKATEYLSEYWSTYDRQEGYDEYEFRTFFADALFGLGVAIDRERYTGPDGFESFLDDLQKHLFENQLKGRPRCA